MTNYFNVLLFILLACNLSAQEAPLTMSLRSDNINMRVGPGKFYPIVWNYRTRGLPVRVIGRHHDWIQIEDESGESGWIYHRLLSSTRTAMTVSDNVFMHRRPDNNADAAAQLMHHVVVTLEYCRASWCMASLPHKGDILTGWIRKSLLWGVAPQDMFGEE